MIPLTELGQAGQIGGRVNGILCFRLVPLKVKGKFYRTGVRSAVILWVSVIGSQEESGTEEADGGNRHAPVYELGESLGRIRVAMSTLGGGLGMG